MLCYVNVGNVFMLRVMLVSLLDIIYKLILEIMYDSAIPYLLQMYHLD